ncbi:hypothetical protein Mp_8g05260 [Marchantia polymorpha subsp. ruderalis]|uniref:Uncharacterized protein n=1 Tax=Marchantia polymorpha TaxID=3197 RepID=A0A2R6WKA8_MARPO|nr:hypothetical protein MARPO_0081s0027 [Marchantia polymorpha]BBN18761.1 hypothetical protein Mp_8g05260 [Marchantia polymorpha subsp. ruderalis]|eukprot:PTQ34300.1 hypothetical protein MARPO_0081s0027 [Marchantia polymorpha]
MPEDDRMRQDTGFSPSWELIHVVTELIEREDECVGAHMNDQGASGDFGVFETKLVISRGLVTFVGAHLSLL